MSILRGFRSLRKKDRHIVIKLLLYILRAEIVLSFLNYSSVRKLIFRINADTSGKRADSVPELKKYLSFLKTILRYLPWRPSCLRQAVAMRDLLASVGYEAKVRIGVGKNQDGFIAHAWIECGGYELLKSGSYSLLKPVNTV